MNSLERVMTAVNYREPDRVPLGEWGIDHDHVREIIGRETFWRNRKAETIALWDNRRDEVVEGQIADCEELVKKMEYDIITVSSVPSKNHHCSDRPKEIADGVWEDSKGHIYKYAASNDSIMAMRQGSGEGLYEVSDAKVEEIAKRVETVDMSTLEQAIYFGDKYGKTHCVLYRDIDIYGIMMSPFGGDYNHQLIVPLLDPDQVKKLHDACVTKNRKVIEILSKHNISVVMYGHDYAMNTGTIMRPETLRDVYFPAMKEVNDIAYANGMIPFFHCCGNTWEILDDYADAGYRAYQSIQLTAGMDNKRIKKEYEGRIALWTGIQCETLVAGTKQQAIDEVKQNLHDLMPGGGFIFGSTNSVQFGAKTENYLAAIDTLRKYGNYR
ncbi:MAG: hypothetical protein IJF16_04665 [Clostridia bacterium]|nr:hypothetical protein [Clostridia bacterium]